jgi:RuvB-like protein 2
LLFFKLS